MAYGSPERLADVPAYYADIRGGRPVRQEVLDDLVERYRVLGIDEGSPLNAITEETRGALERELRDVPVFTGMKHWTPRIAEAAERALATGADIIVGLVLAPHYSRLSIGDYRRRLEGSTRRTGRARLRRQLARRPCPDRPPGRSRPRHGRACRLHRPLPAGPHPRRGRSLQGAAARDVPARC
jgi:protoheme ferro-lyase